MSDQSHGFYEHALDIAREIGDRQGEGNHLGNLGATYANLGEMSKARAFVQQALAILEPIDLQNAQHMRELLAKMDAEAQKNQP